MTKAAAAKSLALETHGVAAGLAAPNEILSDPQSIANCLLPIAH
jgi:hypothetical protein